MTDHAQMVVTEHSPALGQLELWTHQFANERIGQINQSVFFFRRVRQQGADIGKLVDVAEPTDRLASCGLPLNGLQDPLQSDERIAPDM